MTKRQKRNNDENVQAVQSEAGVERVRSSLENKERNDLQGLSTMQNLRERTTKELPQILQDFEQWLKDKNVKPIIPE